VRTTVRPTEVITNFGWIVSPNLAYSPDLAQSDYYIYGR